MLKLLIVETIKSNNLTPKDKQSVIAKVMRRIWTKVTAIFEPEEVEVTFEEDHGKVVSYTYTKVPHKQVA